MKVLIVFSAIFMMAFTCVIYQGDMNLYMHEQETLKMIAEEAACQAALCLDENSYGEGRREFDKKAALEAVSKYIEDSRDLLANGEEYAITYVVHYEDDETGYLPENEKKNPSVTVDISAETDDFFRLPFLTKTEITRKSKYEIKGL